MKYTKKEFDKHDKKSGANYIQVERIKQWMD